MDAMGDDKKDAEWVVVDPEKALQVPRVTGDGTAAASGPRKGVLVVLCGVPGCGKDALGRACAEAFDGAAAISQDEHGGDAAKTQAKAEVLLKDGRSPIFILRNNIDAGERLPYVDAARRHGYRAVAVSPTELAIGAGGPLDSSRRAALFLASVFGCYERLSNGGMQGHETLTCYGGNWQLPAKVCLGFFKGFRVPSAPGEVDAVLSLPFIEEDLTSPSLVPANAETNSASEGSAVVDNAKATPIMLKRVAEQMRQSHHATRGGSMPDDVAYCLKDGDLEQTQSCLRPFAALRRSLPTLTQQLTSWVNEQISVCDSSWVTETESTKTQSKPSREQTKAMQRLMKVRSAVEHLVSPANIAACRPTGSTVSSCVWIPGVEIGDASRPAWPPSYFCGAPQLRKLNTTAEEVVAAARESSVAFAPLQDGDNGVRLTLSGKDGGKGEDLIVPVEKFPSNLRQKLGEMKQP